MPHNSHPCYSTILNLEGHGHDINNTKYEFLSIRRNSMTSIKFIHEPFTIFNCHLEWCYCEDVPFENNYLSELTGDILKFYTLDSDTSN